MKIPLVILVPFLVAPLMAEPEWRTFTSPDGNRTFEGRLQGYDPNQKSATVRTKDGRSLEFPLHRVSEEDQDYIRYAAENLPQEVADVSLDVRFLKALERASTDRDKSTRTATYDAGYGIRIGNRQPHNFMNVEADYILISSKDAVNGSRTTQLTRGSETFDLLGNLTYQVDTSGVQLSSFYKKGSATATGSGGGGCSTCPSSGGGSAVVTRSQRSKDLLIGCVVRIKIDGKVVHVAASSPNLMKYADDFDAAADAQ